MERIWYFGMNGRGWFSRIESRGVTRTVTIKVFYPVPRP